MVKDTIEATRVKASLSSKSDPFLLEIYLELAVWEAAQSQFVRHAPLDDRIRSAGSSTRSAGSPACSTLPGRPRRDRPEQNEAALRTCENIAMHLAEVAEDVRLDGSSSSPTTAMRPEAFPRLMIGAEIAASPAASIQPEQACRNF